MRAGPEIVEEDVVVPQQRLRLRLRRLAQRGVVVVVGASPRSSFLGAGAAVEARCARALALGLGAAVLVEGVDGGELVGVVV